MRTAVVFGIVLLIAGGCSTRSTTNWDGEALREHEHQTVYQFLNANSSLQFVSGPEGGEAMKLPGRDQFVGLFINGELKGQSRDGRKGVRLAEYVPDASLLTELRVSEVAQIAIERVAGGYGEYSGIVRITLRPDSTSTSDQRQ